MNSLVSKGQQLPLFFVGIALGAAVATGVAAIYLRGEVAQLTQSIQTLATEVAKRDDPGMTQGAAQIGLDCPDSESSGPSPGDVIEDLESQIGELKGAIAALQDLSAQMPRAGRPQPFLGIPPMPLGHGADRTIAPRARAPAPLTGWRESAPPDAVTYVDTLFQQHAQEVRERIAAETDPEHPDPSVAMRIISESRQALSDDLRLVLPEEEHEKLFPETPIPAGRSPDGS